MCARSVASLVIPSKFISIHPDIELLSSETRVSIVAMGISPGAEALVAILVFGTLVFK